MPVAARLLLIPILLFAAALAAVPDRLCEAAGGKWAAASGSCITRSCYEAGDCGKWANPSAGCSRLEAGDERAEVFFQLGNPDEIFSDGARWQAGKTSDAWIVGTFRQGRLLDLSCPR